MGWLSFSGRTETPNSQNSPGDSASRNVQGFTAADVKFARTLKFIRQPLELYVEDEDGELEQPGAHGFEARAVAEPNIGVAFLVWLYSVTAFAHEGQSKHPASRA